MSKPILCLDFDGVLHSYASGWVAANFIPDPPVPGALEFLYSALDHFEICIFSSRSGQPGGIAAMRVWLRYWVTKELTPIERANKIINQICSDKRSWPTTKPPAFLTIDARALTFDGNWNNFKPELLLAFKPWNKR